MKPEELEDILDELKSFHADINAEVIVSEILANTSLDQEDIIVKYQSTFKRSFRRDILDFGPIVDDALPIHLSRNGLYDQLPEGLFHKVEKKNSKSSFSEIRKTFKEEEKDARHFFSPFENEFFHQQLNIEKNEQALTQNVLALKDDFFQNFWKIDENIPSEFLQKLFKFLPHSAKIVGDIDLARICLEKLIEKEVSIRIINHSKPKKKNQSSQGQCLGKDFTLDCEYESTLFPTLEVEISVEDYASLDHDLNEDRLLKIVNVFYNYFFPLEYEIKTQFKVKEKNLFTLSPTHQPIVGITTQI
jgi:hypothetical protein